MTEEKKMISILRDRKGIAVVFLVLIAAILVLFILIAIPVYQSYVTKMHAYGCASELATARDMLTIDYIAENSTPTPSDAKEVVTYAMDGWESLCPDGGDTYVIDNPDADEPPYTVVCGLHDKDTCRRTRLNAYHVLKELQQALVDADVRGQELPMEITVTLNSRTYTAVEVESEQAFKRGTASTKGFEKAGTVIYYSISGVSDFSSYSGLEAGQIWYLCFVDENNCAIWHSNDGWTGDSYEGQ